MNTIKKDVTINEHITINDCTLVSAGNFGGTVYEYLVKELTSEEKEALVDGQILDDPNDNYMVFHLIDGEYNDDGWYVSWKTVGEALSAIQLEFRGTSMDEVNYPSRNEEVETYLKKNEYFFDYEE